MNFIEYHVKPADEGMSVGDIVSKRMNVSKRLLKRCKHHERGILVNNVRQTVRYIVKNGDVVSLAMNPALKSSDVIQEKGELKVIFEDQYFMIVDKPPGMTMFPRKRGEKGSLAGLVLNHLQKYSDDVSICHYLTRLDLGTSGLVLIAKNSYVTQQFNIVRPQKYYQALAYGEIKYPMRLEGRIYELSDAIRTETGMVFSIGKNGKASTTACTPIFYNEQFNFTGLWIQLLTGRRHQIRVHLSHQGHPLINDTMYGGPLMGFNRPYLHAAVLDFFHPITHEKKHFFLPVHTYGGNYPVFNHEAWLVDYSLNERR